MTKAASLHPCSSRSFRATALPEQVDSFYRRSRASEGKASPTRPASTPEHQYRAMPPIPARPRPRASPSSSLRSPAREKAAPSHPSQRPAADRRIRRRELESRTRGKRLRSGMVQRRAVSQYFHLLQGNEAAADHAVEDGEEGVDLLLAVDDLDDDRQVFREAQDLGGVQPAGMAETERAAQNGGPGEMPFARLEHDRLVERTVLASLVLADEDPQQNGVPWDLHGVAPIR